MNDWLSSVKAPIEVNNAKQAVEFKDGAIGPVKFTLPQPIGVLIVAEFVRISPFMVNARPSSVSLLFIEIAPPETIVPRIVVPAPKVTAPLSFQKTLQAFAPLIKITFEFALVLKANAVLKIKQ